VARPERLLSILCCVVPRIGLLRLRLGAALFGRFGLFALFALFFDYPLTLTTGHAAGQEGQT
jgi:hypothetical protein